jgi:alpha-L-arabinofuranosidase
MVADHFGDTVVDCFVDCPTFTCRHPKHFAGIVEVDEQGKEVESEVQRSLRREFEGLPYLDVCATMDGRHGRLTLSVVNRHETEVIEASVQVLGRPVRGTVAGEVLTAGSVKAENSFESPATVMPRAAETLPAGNEFVYRFPPHSYTVLRVEQGGRATQ